MQRKADRPVLIAVEAVHQNRQPVPETGDRLVEHFQDPDLCRQRDPGERKQIDAAIIRARVIAYDKTGRPYAKTRFRLFAASSWSYPSWQ